MNEIRVATAQFEARDGDKPYNLSAIDGLSAQAASGGAAMVCFHECCIPGYTFLGGLTRSEVEALAEPLPDGPSIEKLRSIARRHDLMVGAGLVEREGDRLYNTYAVVSAEGLIARHRKLHAFVSQHLSCGNGYTVFEAQGWKWGILICYDNNLPENGRMTAMLGADVILAPHVTGCLPSPAPGRGTVDAAVWNERHRDPVRCRMEFDGPKGRGWITKWLPARAWENGVYVVYANVIGLDGGTVKPGGSMVIDPFGEIAAECRSLGDEVAVATLVPENRRLASGESYIRARRPELYGGMVEPNPNLGPDRRPDVWWQKHGRGR
ncbi:MAG: nitrilase-related carbon-nitrogen hydrolase [Bryobacteraceae bacterium]